MLFLSTERGINNCHQAFNITSFSKRVFSKVRRKTQHQNPEFGPKKPG
jgi:hypothetical protein